jgi:TonB family protein
MKNSTTTYCTILIAMLFMLFTNRVNAQDSKIKKVLTDIIAGKNIDAKKLLDVLDSDSRYQSDLYFWYARTLCYKNIALASENNSKDLEEARKSFNKLVEIDKLNEPSPNVKIISELRKDLYEGKNALKVATNSSSSSTVVASNQSDVQDADKTVSLVVTGQGKTPDEAKQSALRSAIEQAFGAFISSKTEILNDNLVKDEIVSVSNGNIQKFEVLSESKLPDASYSLTVKAIVSINKLTSFVESKGISVEIQGGLFALNIKQQLLNEQGEAKAICNITSVLHQFLQRAFDYQISSENPKSVDGNSTSWIIPNTITITANTNYTACAEYLIKNLSIIGLNSAEIENYKKLNKNVFPITITFNKKVKTYYLRNESSLANINYILTGNYKEYLRLFVVNSGIEKKFGYETIFYNKSGVDEFTILNTDQNGVMFYNFLNAGTQVGSISYNDTKTVAEIEKIKSYIISPTGSNSFFGCDLNTKITDKNRIDVAKGQNMNQINNVKSYPEFPGGVNALNSFLNKNVIYPEKALQSRITGKIFVGFVIDAVGKVDIDKISIVKGGDFLLEQEAIRIAKNLPQFTPAKDQNDVPVSSWFQFPISFNIQ